MNVIVDGVDVECKEQVVISEEGIVGCNCNSGTHTEVHGEYVTTIDEDGITVEILDSSDDVLKSCFMSFSNLYSEMNKTIAIMKNKDGIVRLEGLFK